MLDAVPELAEKNFVSKLLKSQVTLWILVVIGILVHGYMGRTWSAVQSFQVNDNWCNLKSEGIGFHCFGDFGLPYYRGMQDQVYAPGNFAAANTPITALLFELLRFFSYNKALLVYLLALLASTIIPFSLSKNLGPVSNRLVLSIFCGVLTTGSISALDRGNHVVLLIPLLYFYVIAVEEERWNRAVGLLICVSLLKFWGIIFIVALIARRQWARSLLSALAVPLISAVAIGLFPGSLMGNIRAMLAMVTNRDYSNSIAGYSISIVGFFRRVSCALTSTDVCNTRISSSSFFSSTYFSFTVLISLLTLVFILMKSKNTPTHIWIAALISLGFLSVPDAPVYNMSLTAVIVAVFATKKVVIDTWKLSNYSLLGALLVSNTPFTFYSNAVSRFSSTSGDNLPIFRSDYWIMPLAWIIFILAVIYDLVDNRFIKHNNY